MDNKIKKYVTNLLLTTVLGGVIGFLNYLFNVGLARYTSENIFSIYAAAIGIVYLIQIPATSIQNVLTKAIGETPGGNISKFRVKSFIIFSVLGALFGTTFLLFTPRISNTASIPEYVIPSLAITLALSFISPIAKGILLGKEKIIKVNLILLSETLLRFAIGFLAIKLDGNINLIILANALPSFLSCILILPLIKTEKKNKTDIKINIKELILMTVSFLLLSAPYTLDLILVPEGFRAQYGALSLIGKLVYFASITVASVMFARLSNQEDKREEIRTVSITVVLTLIIGLAMSIGIFLFKDLLINFAFDGKYAEISTYFVLFGLSMSVYAVVYMLANFFFSRSSYWYILVLILTTILQIVLFRSFTTDIVTVVRNQVVVYGSLLILTIGYFIFNFIFKKDEKIKT